METDVYLLCNKCNGITNGKGNGDITDTIICNRCGNKVKARLVGNLTIEIKENDKRWFYINEETSNILIT